MEKAPGQIEDCLKVDRQNRYAAIKAFENDWEALGTLPVSDRQKQKTAAIRKSLEEALDDEAESIIADQRHAWVASRLDGIYTQNDAHELSLSDRIDRVVTNRWLAIPIFILVMGVVYWIALSTVGTWMTDWVNGVFVAEWCQGGMTVFPESVHASPAVISLVVDGVIGGIGALLGFVPQMAVIF